MSGEAGRHRGANRLLVLTLLLSVLLGSACRSSVPGYEPEEEFPGGKTTTSFVPFPSSELPASNLPAALRSGFFAGRALAGQPWVKAPTITEARDGLGPLYNARTCFECHKRGGKGQVPRGVEEPLTGGLVRLSIPGEEARLGAVPEPTYGLQLQTRSTALSDEIASRGGAELKTSVPAEAKVFLRWVTREVSVTQDHEVSLLLPEIVLTNLGYGALHPDTRMSLRVAPPLHGAGLIELIDQRDLDALADPNDRDGDGISGRVNRVWDRREQKTTAGRFGYKANLATLDDTVGGALAGDIGITNSLFTRQPCTQQQFGCLRQPAGALPSQHEINDRLLALVVDFNRNLGVPRRRAPQGPVELTGREVFYESGCASCHHPRYRTLPSVPNRHLGEQLIWPYSDFLLHDMGPELADHRSDYLATGSEWRTTPLWGLGVSSKVTGSESYLHDGRARSLEEAIFWHGGEAALARSRYAGLGTEERASLIAFLRSL